LDRNISEITYIVCHYISNEHDYYYLTTVYGKRSFLSKESDTSRSYRVYISPTMLASSALIQVLLPYLFTFSLNLKLSLVWTHHIRYLT